MTSIKKSKIDACESDEVLFQFYKDSLDEDLKKSIAHHLDKCDNCLIKIREFAFIESQFNDSEALEKVPHDLIKNITNTLSLQSTDSLVGRAALAVQLIKGGLKILEETILPPEANLRFTEFADQTMIFRGDAKTVDSELILEQTLTDKTITAFMAVKRDEGETLGFVIFLTESNMPIPKVRISLKQQDTFLASKRTDSRGVVEFLHISPGRYSIWIPAQNIEWSIDIRI